MIHIVVLLLFIVTVSINLVANKYNYMVLKIISKPLLMPLLILFYIVSTEERNCLIILALIFGFLGDVFLMLKSKKVFFLLGLFSFLLGHITYILLFLNSISTSISSSMVMWYVLLAIPYLMYCCLLLKNIVPYAGNLKIPVIIYAIVIVFMSYSSFVRIQDFAGLNLWLPIIGSLLFVISDTFLALGIYTQKITNSSFKVMITYIFAQFFIVLGFII